MPESYQADVLRLSDIDSDLLISCVAAYGLSVRFVETGSEIPGSHWGDDEAGLIGQHLYVRPDPPLHSALHEACHWILMDETRRANLHTDAGGTSTEENAVCYLQILLSDQFASMGRARMFRDMDRWGYSFRLGSTQAWFESDAEDAIAFLQQKGFDPLITYTPIG